MTNFLDAWSWEANPPKPKSCKSHQVLPSFSGHKKEHKGTGRHTR